MSTQSVSYADAMQEEEQAKVDAGNRHKAYAKAFHLSEVYGVDPVNNDGELLISVKHGVATYA